MKTSSGSEGWLGAISESVLGLGMGWRKLSQSPLLFMNGEVRG